MPGISGLVVTCLAASTLVSVCRATFAGGLRGNNVVSASTEPQRHETGLAQDDSAAQAHNVSRERKCGILWFYHVPKCGGMSVFKWLQDARRGGLIDEHIQVFFSDDNPRLPGLSTDYETFHREHFEPILANPVGKLYAVHHHHHTPGMKEFAPRFVSMKSRLREAGCDLYRATFLREPKSRLTSALLFNTFDWNTSWTRPEHASQWDEKTIATVERTLADTRSSRYFNREITYLMHNNKYDRDSSFRQHVDTMLNITEALDVLREFEFVGLTEEMGEGIQEMADMVGLRGMVPVTNERHNVGSHDTRTEDLPLRLLEMVEANTRLDTRLYAEAAGMWETRKLDKRRQETTTILASAERLADDARRRFDDALRVAKTWKERLFSLTNGPTAQDEAFMDDKSNLLSIAATTEDDSDMVNQVSKLYDSYLEKYDHAMDRASKILKNDVAEEAS
mmetsp:Transcript_108098/g.304496  ORF Transcript_108098/g.304496 Transcript_108098/m.304496 type:complete len:451 (+) Transcript_108098:153-1505(+)